MPLESALYELAGDLSGVGLVLAAGDLLAQSPDALRPNVRGGFDGGVGAGEFAATLSYPRAIRFADGFRRRCSGPSGMKIVDNASGPIVRRRFSHFWHMRCPTFAS